MSDVRFVAGIVTLHLELGPSASFQIKTRYPKTIPFLKGFGIIDHSCPTDVELVLNQLEFGGAISGTARQ
jgi:hypothetical protein